MSDPLRSPANPDPVPTRLPSNGLARTQTPATAPVSIKLDANASTNTSTSASAVAVASSPERPLLLLTGRLVGLDEVHELRHLITRINARGFSTKIACVSIPAAVTEHKSLDAPAFLKEFKPKDPIVPYPGLDSYWRRFWILRKLFANSEGDPQRSPDASRYSEYARTMEHPNQGQHANEQENGRPWLLHVLRHRMAEAGLEIAEYWRLPYIVTVNEFIAPDAGLRLSKRWCRGLIALSEELADDLVQSMGIPRDFIRVVRPGVALQCENPPAATAVPAPTPTPAPAPVPAVPTSKPKSAAGIGGANPGSIAGLNKIHQRPSSSSRSGISAPQRLPVIGTAGRLGSGSGMITFLHAARRVLDQGVDAEFVIAAHASSASESEVRDRAKRLKIMDHITLTTDPMLRPNFWAVLNLFCLTSQTPTVGLPIVRAQIRGLPVIATDVTGPNALIRHNVTGLLIPPNDSEALARAMLELLRDRDRARALGLAGCAYAAEAFNPQREADELAQCYAEMMNRPPMLISAASHRKSL